MKEVNLVKRVSVSLNESETACIRLSSGGTTSAASILYPPLCFQPISELFPPPSSLHTFPLLCTHLNSFLHSLKSLSARNLPPVVGTCAAFVAAAPAATAAAAGVTIAATAAAATAAASVVVVVVAVG